MSMAPCRSESSIRILMPSVVSCVRSWTLRRMQTTSIPQHACMHACDARARVRQVDGCPAGRTAPAGSKTSQSTGQTCLGIKARRRRSQSAQREKDECGMVLPCSQRTPKLRSCCADDFVSSDIRKRRTTASSNYSKKNLAQNSSVQCTHPLDLNQYTNTWSHCSILGQILTTDLIQKYKLCPVRGNTPGILKRRENVARHHNASPVINFL